MLVREHSHRQCNICLAQFAARRLFTHCQIDRCMKMNKQNRKRTHKQYENSISQIKSCQFSWLLFYFRLVFTEHLSDSLLPFHHPPSHCQTILFRSLFWCLATIASDTTVTAAVLHFNKNRRRLWRTISLFVQPKDTKGNISTSAFGVLMFYTAQDSKKERKKIEIKWFQLMPSTRYQITAMELNEFFPRGELMGWFCTCTGVGGKFNLGFMFVSWLINWKLIRLVFMRFTRFISQKSWIY